MTTVKESLLQNLKSQWKVTVKKQYQKEPDKVKNANIDKNTDDMMSNPIVKVAAKQAQITKEDIRKILAEIRDEIISENQT